MAQDLNMVLDSKVQSLQEIINSSPPESVAISDNNALKLQVKVLTAQTADKDVQIDTLRSKIDTLDVGLEQMAGQLEKVSMEREKALSDAKESSMVSQKQQRDLEKQSSDINTLKEAISVFERDIAIKDNKLENLNTLKEQLLEENLKNNAQDLKDLLKHKDALIANLQSQLDGHAAKVIPQESVTALES